jgi:hypothetical protein
MPNIQTTEYKEFIKQIKTKYIRQWYLFYSTPKGQQVVAQLVMIPWGHNLHIVTKCKDINQALFYVQETINNSWSRTILVHQIESRLYEREGKALIDNITSFLLELESALPSIEEIEEEMRSLEEKKND